MLAKASPVTMSSSHTEVTMAAETTDTHNIRRELAQTGQDPFHIAALAIEQNKRLRRRIDDLENRLLKRHT